MPTLTSEPAAAAAVRDSRQKLLERAWHHQYAGSALIEVLHTARELFGYLPPQLPCTDAQKLHLLSSRVLALRAEDGVANRAGYLIRPVAATVVATHNKRRPKRLQEMTAAEVVMFLDADPKRLRRTSKSSMSKSGVLQRCRI